MTDRQQQLVDQLADALNLAMTRLFEQTGNRCLPGEDALARYAALTESNNSRPAKCDEGFVGCDGSHANHWAMVREHGFGPSDQADQRVRDAEGQRQGQQEPRGHREAKDHDNGNGSENDDSQHRDERVLECADEEVHATSIAGSVPEERFAESMEIGWTLPAKCRGCARDGQIQGRGKKPECEFVWLSCFTCQAPEGRFRDG